MLSKCLYWLTIKNNFPLFVGNQIPQRNVAFLHTMNEDIILKQDKFVQGRTLKPVRRSILKAKSSSFKNILNRFVSADGLKKSCANAIGPRLCKQSFLSGKKVSELVAGQGAPVYS